MKTIVTRTALVFVALAMALFAWAGVAAAQNSYAPGAPQLSYGGPYGTDPAQPNGGDLGFGANVTPSDSAAADSVGGTGGGLAVTGTDVEAPLFAGIALMATGGVVLVASRRREI